MVGTILEKIGAKMQDVSSMIDALIVREGGFVNDPDDPGGATKYGITIATLSSTRGKRASVAEVRALTKAEAKSIYEAQYLTRPKIDQLPAPLVPSVFDMYVNAGNRAIKILQETLGKFGLKLAVDGAIGPQTLSACHEVFAQAGENLVDAYGIERREFYYRLADRRAASRKYARTRAGGKGGWIRRAEEFISARYHLSPDEHQMRIAAWR